MMRIAKKLVERAYRERAGMIGVLEACNLGVRNERYVCSFPIEPHATSTGHHEHCPGHLVMLQMLARDAAGGAS